MVNLKVKIVPSSEASKSEHTLKKGKRMVESLITNLKLGPLLRIGPNEITFYSIDIYKKVYSFRSPFRKDPRVYGQFVQDGHPALFSIT